MKKTFLLLLVTLIIYFPPISVYFAVKTSEKLQASEQFANLEEKIATDLQQLDRSIDDAEFMMLEQTRIRELLSNNILNLSTNYHNGRLEAFANETVPNILIRAGFPVELEILLFNDDQTISKSLHYGTELGLQKLTSLIKLSKAYDSSKITQISHVASFPQIQFFFANCLEGLIDRKMSKMVFRNNGKCLMLVGERINERACIFSLSDLSAINLKKSQQIKIQNFPDREYGLGVVSPEWPESYLSKYFQQQPLFGKKLTRLSRSIQDGEFRLSLDGHEVFFSSLDKMKNCRYFAATPLVTPDSTDSLPLNMLIAALFIISCIFFKVIVEKIVLERGADLSIKVMIPATFVFLVIQPIFASAYLTSEFFHVSYTSEKSKVADKLLSELIEIDMKSFDNANETLNIARGLNSIERIASYTGRHYEGDDQALGVNLLSKLFADFSGNRFMSLWFCRGENLSLRVLFQPDNTYAIEKVNSPIANFFKKRFLQIMALSSAKDQVRANENTDKQGKELKDELSRDFFLKIFSPDTFYKFRQNSGILFDISSVDKHAQVLTGPISYHGKTFAYAAWHIDKQQTNMLLPQHLLTLDSKSPRIALYGNQYKIESLKYSMNSLIRAHPELEKVAEVAHLTKTKVSSKTETPSHTRIIEAIPANHSISAIAGSELMKSSQQFRKDMEIQIAMFVGAILLTGGTLAFAGAIYFTWPLRELTGATGEIVRGNFSVRIKEDHPDEFADIGIAFNRMANSLEEGQMLKSFVSDTVRKEVAESSSGALAEKAETRVATVIFAAICGFSDFQKTHNAKEVFTLLQMLLQAADEATQKFGGEIDKMIEDKIMIVFEHQGSNSTDIVEKAVRTASYICEQITLQTGMSVGAGINTGLTVAGIMGAEQARLSRTVVGDPVNLAARLACEAVKMNGGLVVSGQILTDLPGEYHAEKLPISTVKGKTQTIEAYRIINRRESK